MSFLYECHYQIVGSQNKFIFILAASNSRKLGHSIIFNSQEKCIRAMYDFQRLLQNKNNIRRIVELDSGRHSFEVVNEKREMLYYSINYKGIAQLRKGIENQLEAAKAKIILYRYVDIKK